MNQQEESKLEHSAQAYRKRNQLYVNNSYYKSIVKSFAPLFIHNQRYISLINSLRKLLG